MQSQNAAFIVVKADLPPGATSLAAAAPSESPADLLTVQQAVNEFG